MQIKHLWHKHGGRITEVLGVGHRTVEGVAYWFYLCNVNWTDGGVSEGIEVMPDRLCCSDDNPEAKVEFDRVSAALTSHLHEEGRWLKKGRWVGERLVHWVAKQPVGVDLLS